MTAQLQRLIQELEEERNFVSAILDTAGALVFVLDTQGRFIRFNRACEQMTGYSTQEVEGQHFWDLFVPPEEVSAAKTAFPKLQAAQFPNQYEKYWVVRDGSRRLIAWSNTALVDADGSLKYIITTGIDITERKQSEEKFAKAFRSSPDAMLLTTLSDGRLIEVNDSFLSISGYSREEVIGQTIFELNGWVNPADRDKVIRLLQEEKVVRNQEFEFRHKSGRVVVGLFSAELINLNGELSLLTVTNDITEHKRAEEQLRASIERVSEVNQRSRLLAEMALRIRNSLDLKQILDTTVTEVRHFLQAERVFIVINNRDEGSCAQVVAESVAPNWGSMREWRPRDEEHLRELRAFFAKERVEVIDDTTSGELTVAIAQDCLEYQIKACLNVPIMLNNRLLALLAVNQCTGPRQWQPSEIDLLEKLGTQVAIAIQQAELYQQIQALNASLERQVEERTAQLQQKMQELQALYQTKDVFLHAFSHDLRTPIFGTSLVLKNLLNQAEETVTVSRSLLERMVGSSDRQLNLINSLLEAHSSEVQGIILHREPVQLGQLTQMIVEDLEPLVSKNQAILTNLVPDDLPVISADPIQLSRVFENLLVNALKHNLPKLNLTLNATLEEHSIRCTVVDDGQGMSQEQCDRLFDLYYRGGSSRHFTGIGLGLYLCQQIITAHEGEVGVISSLGVGTTFWFTLPIKSSAIAL